MIHNPNDATVMGLRPSPKALSLLIRVRAFLAEEDRAVACAIQRGLASRANEFFELGLFEGAIGHFHRTLHALLDDGGRS